MTDDFTRPLRPCGDQELSEVHPLEFGDAPRESDRGPHWNRVLSTVQKLGVMGDLDGDLDYALKTSRIFAEKDVHVLLQLGNFGIVWPERRNWRVDLNRLKRSLTQHRQTLYFADGNEDWHPWLDRFPVSDDGLHWLTNNIAHMPRGYRAPIGLSTLAALGGANSASRRIEGNGWWAAEQITEADLGRLGYEHADILVGHEAPLHVPGLDSSIAGDVLDPVDAAYARESRVMFQRAVMQARPRLTLGGHHHRFIDEVVHYQARTEEFSTRVVLLDRGGENRINLAVLNTGTLGLRFLDSAGRSCAEHFS